MQTGVLKPYSLTVSCAELSSLWYWNTKEILFLPKEFLGPLSLLSFFFSVPKPSPQILLTQVYVWSQWLVAAGWHWGVTGERHPPSWLLLRWPPIREKLTQLWITHFGKRSCYLRSIFLTVWFSFPRRVCFWKIGYRNICNILTSRTYTNTYYNMIYPEDTGHVFVDWLDNPKTRVRDPHPPILWLRVILHLNCLLWIISESDLYFQWQKQHQMKLDWNCEAPLRKLPNCAIP